MNLSIWLAAIRPKTLLISVAPILLSQVLVLQEICQSGQLGHGLFSPSLAVLILTCALCLQIAVNLANDYYDYISGVDTEDRLGPDRAAEQGLLSPQAIHNAYRVFLALGIVAGLSLIWHSHAYMSLLGLVCIFAVMTYSAGPLPLAYHGLGELSVLIVFGPIAILGGFFVQLSYLTVDVIGPALAMGALASAVMLVNNIRDIASDQAAGKNTLAAYVGEKGSKYLYGIFLLIALMAASVSLHQPPRFSYILVPVTLLLAFLIHRRSGAQLNKQLGQTAFLMLVFSATLSLDLLLD